MKYSVVIPPLTRALSANGQLVVRIENGQYRACAFDENGLGSCANGTTPEAAISNLESALVAKSVESEASNES